MGFLLVLFITILNLLFQIGNFWQFFLYNQVFFGTNWYHMVLSGTTWYFLTFKGGGVVHRALLPLNAWPLKAGHASTTF